MKSLRDHLAQYLKLRRQLGYKLKESEFLLRSFTTLAEEEGAEFIATKLELRWAAPPHLKPAQGGSRLSTLRRFAAYVSAFDARTQVPPQKLLPYQLTRRNPFHYSDENVAQLIKAPREIDSSGGIKGLTLSTVLGLLAVTGMRVGEALALDYGDFDADKGILTVRLSKGSKSRMVPLHESATLALRCYASARDSIYVKRTSPAFFVWEGGDRLVYDSVNRWFLLVACQIGLRKPGDVHGPRVHDLRHHSECRIIPISEYVTTLPFELS